MSAINSLPVPHTMQRDHFIQVDISGPKGVGKSTLARDIADALAMKGYCPHVMDDGAEYMPSNTVSPVASGKAFGLVSILTHEPHGGDGIYFLAGLDFTDELPCSVRQRINQLSEVGLMAVTADQIQSHITQPTTLVGQALPMQPTAQREQIAQGVGQIRITLTIDQLPQAQCL